MPFSSTRSEVGKQAYVTLWVLNFTESHREAPSQVLVKEFSRAEALSRETFSSLCRIAFGTWGDAFCLLLNGHCPAIVRP